jgi:hypothetical protein
MEKKKGIIIVQLANNIIAIVIAILKDALMGSALVCCCVDLRWKYRGDGHGIQELSGSVKGLECHF